MISTVYAIFWSLVFYRHQKNSASIHTMTNLLYETLDYYSIDDGIGGTLSCCLKLPFYALLFAVSMVFLLLWCLFCCCCPFCPEWFRNLPDRIFGSDPDGKLQLDSYETAAWPICEGKWVLFKVV